MPHSKKENQNDTWGYFSLNSDDGKYRGNKPECAAQGKITAILNERYLFM